MTMATLIQELTIACAFHHATGAPFYRQWIADVIRETAEHPDFPPTLVAAARDAVKGLA